MSHIPTPSDSAAPSSGAGTPKEYYSVRELARYLGVSVATIWRMVQDDKLPPGIKFTRGTTRWSITAVKQQLATAQ